ncbi:hypothetical protein ABZP36_031253 [Zizania latifolia]
MTWPPPLLSEARSGPHPRLGVAWCPSWGCGVRRQRLRGLLARMRQRGRGCDWLGHNGGAARSMSWGGGARLRSRWQGTTTGQPAPGQGAATASRWQMHLHPTTGLGILDLGWDFASENENSLLVATQFFCVFSS